MKTITIKLTDNGNYVACVMPIIGQQSSLHCIHVFDADYKFIKTEKSHPMFSWVSNCRTIGSIGGCRFEPDEISGLLEKFVKYGIEGYTTAFSLRSGCKAYLLAPHAALIR